MERYYVVYLLKLYINKDESYLLHTTTYSIKKDVEKLIDDFQKQIIEVVNKTYSPKYVNVEIINFIKL